MIAALAAALALTLVAQVTPALADADTAAPSGGGTVTLPAPGSAADQNLTAWIDQIEADPNRFDQLLEEDCVERGGPACAMGAAEIQQIPGDLKAVTDSLVAEIQQNKALDAEINADLNSAGPQTRAAGGIFQAIAAIAKASTNKAVQALAKNSDKIGKYTDNVSRAVYAHDGIKDGTAASIAKVAIYSMPVIGDVFSLGEAFLDPNMTTAKRVETGVVASLSLISAAVGLLATSPAGIAAGVVIGIGVAAWYVGKAIWGWITGGSSTKEMQAPPPTPEDLFKNGAELKWVTHKVNGKDVVLEIPKGGTSVSQTLLVDSKWTAYNKNDKPVDYTIRAYNHYILDPFFGGGLSLHTTWAVEEATLEVWQGGKKYPGTCGQIDDSRLYLDGRPWNVGDFGCAPNAPMTIGLGKPAVFKITYQYNLRCTPDPFGLIDCKQPPAEAKPHADLEVDAKSTDGKTHQVALPIPYTYAIIG